MSRRALLAASAGLTVALAGAVPLAVQAQTTLPWDKFPPKKRAMAQREANARVKAQVAVRPPKDAIKRLDVSPPAPIPFSALPHLAAGDGTIVQTGLAPFSSSQCIFENHWYRAIGGEEIIVYAGVETRDRDQGVLVVLAHTATGGVDAGQGGKYPTPTKAGAVRVAGATGERLTLATANGASLSFDLASRTYASPA